jgi:UDP-N-acetylmuramate dehydrogenase
MIQIIRDVPLKEKTTYRIGGRAAHYCAPENADEISGILEWAEKQMLPVLIIGNGSNLLVSDTGWTGLVIDTTGLCGITWQNSTVECGSGVSLSRLVWQSVERGLGGIQHLAGIPGTVGGAVAMNAGAFGCEIGQRVECVDIIEKKDRRIRRLLKHEISFEYRNSSLKCSGDIVTGAVIRLSPGEKSVLRMEYDDILRKRAEKQPLDKPNCGSVFKRPLGNFAGTLIENCGLKGTRMGGAEISSRHANFILNNGSASAEDVRQLISLVRKKVWESTKVLLEPEVEFAGQFETELFKPEE